jgi:phenylalanyl-tRNA synthetase alpha subunit
MIKISVDKKKVAKAKQFLINNRVIVAFVVMLTIILVLWQQSYSKQKKIDELNAVIKLEDKIKEIESKLTEMRDRESNVYPEITRKLQNLEKARQDYKKLEAQLKKPTKEGVTNDINKLNMEEVNRIFNSLGYDTAVGPVGK